jgi:hypothetical protein
MSADLRAVTRAAARAALVPAGAFAVHQLRYELAYGGRAGLELARQGHNYLHSLAPWIVLGICVAVGGYLAAFGRALGGHRSVSRHALSLAGLWLLCTVCLLGIYVAQELLEGVLATGHPAGLAGVFGYGGWWAIPAAASVGLVLAALFHGASWVLDEIVRLRGRRHPQAARAGLLALRPSGRIGLAPRPAPLAAGWSGRGPPR